MKGFLASWRGYGLVALTVVVIASAMTLTLVRTVLPPKAPTGEAAPAASPSSPAPSPTAPSPTAPSRTASAAPLPVGVEQTDGVTFYTVQPFDVGRREGTLAYIAARFGTTVAQLVEWNNLMNPDLIHPGQRLRVS